MISIHALREEGDFIDDELVTLLQNFYPRPPRGGRPVSPPSYGVVVKFLSTPSARRATVSATSGEQTRSISIHALREEGDKGLGK